MNKQKETTNEKAPKAKSKGVNDKQELVGFVFLDKNGALLRRKKDKPKQTLSTIQLATLSLMQQTRQPAIKYYGVTYLISGTTAQVEQNTLESLVKKGFLRKTFLLAVPAYELAKAVAK